jgi:hypothetical protein
MHGLPSLVRCMYLHRFTRACVWQELPLALEPMHQVGKRESEIFFNMHAPRGAWCMPTPGRMHVCSIDIGWWFSSWDMRACISRKDSMWLGCMPFHFCCESRTILPACHAVTHHPVSHQSGVI